LQVEWILSAGMIKYVSSVYFEIKLFRLTDSKSDVVTTGQPDRVSLNYTDVLS